MILETKVPEYFTSVRLKDLLRRPVLVDRQQYSDQAAHDHRIAISGEVQRAVAAGGLQPDLTNAATNLVGLGLDRLRHFWKRFAQFDDVSVFVFPIIEKGKIVAYFGNVHCGVAWVPVTGLLTDT